MIWYEKLMMGPETKSIVLVHLMKTVNVVSEFVTPVFGSVATTFTT